MFIPLLKDFHPFLELVVSPSRLDILDSETSYQQVSPWLLIKCQHPGPSTDQLNQSPWGWIISDRNV